MISLEERSPASKTQSWQIPAVRPRLCGQRGRPPCRFAGRLTLRRWREVEQNFIVPENVQSLIWEDLVPSLLSSAVLPRWWRVTSNELHAVALYQQIRRGAFGSRRPE